MDVEAPGRARPSEGGEGRTRLGASRTPALRRRRIEEQGGPARACFSSHVVKELAWVSQGAMSVVALVVVSVLVLQELGLGLVEDHSASWCVQALAWTSGVTAVVGGVYEYLLLLLPLLAVGQSTVV